MYYDFLQYKLVTNISGDLQAMLVLTLVVVRWWRINNGITGSIASGIMDSIWASPVVAV